MAYAYKNSKGTNYYLHSKKVELRGGGRTQVIYYFAKSAGAGAIDEIPQGFKIKESERTGLPFLTKSK